MTLPPSPVLSPATAITTTIPAGDGLPITTAASTTVHRRLSLIPLIFIIYFDVAGGPFGAEPAVKAVGPLFAILEFLIFPFIWSIPEALVTAELSTALPGNGGYIIWTYKAFGPFMASLLGVLKYLTCVINLSSYPVLGVQYLETLFPILNSGLPRIAAMMGISTVLSFITFLGVNIVGILSIILGILTLCPFGIMAGFAVPHIKPERWLSMGQKGVKRNWNGSFNNVFWNLNFWDTISTMAGEVENPRTTFPKALLYAVVLTCLAYIIPLMAVTGALDLDQNAWESGYFAVAAATIVGKWLRVWIIIGAMLSTIGLFFALLCSCSYQILGMSDFGFLPKFFGAKSKFDTPWIGILLSTLIVMVCSVFLDFTVIIAAANLLYSLSMLIEYASYFWLRVKYPTLRRPYRVPIDNKILLAVALMIPSSFLVLIMVFATKIPRIICALITIGAVLWYFLMNFIKKKGWLAFKNADQIEVGEEQD
uniref:probable polyamine transporter At3g13620 n=1 Tax=Erigeron canadensis TaxID=72917 RepID=UPI001CB9C270|nr:probable polyamine transporter At3g13620 [Erigeron canadensis]